MSNLEFTEYVAAQPVYGGQTGLTRGQENATQQVAIGASSAVSAAFNSRTNLIEVTAVGADCRVAIGAPASVAATNSVTFSRRLRAGGAYRFAVEPGQALAVIAVEGGADTAAPVTAAGAATAANQATEIASLASMASGAGIFATASFMPAAAAYSANDVMGTTPVQSFTFAYAGSGLAIPATALIRVLTAIVRIDQTALQASEGAYQLQGYNATPPSAQADNDAWSLASADLAAHRGPIPLGTPVDLGAACYVKSPNIDLDIRLATGVLFAELQTLAGFTATAVARQVTLYGIVL